MGNTKNRQERRSGRAVLVWGLVFVWAAFFGLAGCAGLAEQSGRLLDGSAFAEKTLARYRDRAAPGAGLEVRELADRRGEKSLAILPEEFPGIRFQTSAPGEGGIFYVTGLRYLGGNVSGWNEFTLELSGAGTFTAAKGTAVLSFPGPPEMVQIAAGKIRRGESRITGDEALGSLRSRHERILALTGWMLSRPGRPIFTELTDFDAYWRPLLLPETAAPKKRPPEWWREGARWVRAEDTRWNAAYTELLFPEELRPLRDSGALLRDWEEALDWIYFAYSWEKIAARLSGTIFLDQIK
jgi:hypothetical protein